MRIEAIVFDLGGTLLEYAGEYTSWPELEAPGFGAVHKYLNGLNHPFPNLADFRSIGFDLLAVRGHQATSGKQNRTVKSLLIDVLASFEIEISEDEVLDEAATRYQAAVCAGVRPMPYCHETVRTLKESGLKLGLVSNTMFSGSMHVADMRKFDLDGFFDSMVFSADLNKWKPNPAPFHHVLSRLDVEPSSAVFVGDDPAADVTGAKRAGLFTIHYPSSQRFSSPDGLNPDATIRNLLELQAIINQLNETSGHDTLNSA